MAQPRGVDEATWREGEEKGRESNAESLEHGPGRGQVEEIVLTSKKSFYFMLSKKSQSQKTI